MEGKKIIQGIFDMCKFTGFRWIPAYRWFEGKTRYAHVIVVWVSARGYLVCGVTNCSAFDANKLEEKFGGEGNNTDWCAELSLGDPDLTRNVADLVNGLTYFIATEFD